jgi:hypothetical protein
MQTIVRLEQQHFLSQLANHRSNVVRFIMACSAETPHRTATIWETWLPPLVALFGNAKRAAAPRLDVEALPDHLKRDLGFLDGRTSYREDSR